MISTKDLLTAATQHIANGQAGSAAPVQVPIAVLDQGGYRLTSDTAEVSARVALVAATRALTAYPGPDFPQIARVGGGWPSEEDVFVALQVPLPTPRHRRDDVFAVRWIGRVGEITVMCHRCSLRPAVVPEFGVCADHASEPQLRGMLTRWSVRRGRLDVERDTLIRTAHANRLNKHQIHEASNVARTTIDRVLARDTED